MSEHQAAEYGIVLPPNEPTISAMANMVLRLACIPERLALEDRTKVVHRTGRAENVAEHSLMLTIIAPALAEQYYANLDANLVARYASIHDLLEAYTGDTPTYDYKTVDHAAKEEREVRAITRLKADFHSQPGLIRLVTEYINQIVPEARFVRVADKVMPLLIHFQDQGATLRTFNTREQLLSDTSARNVHLREHYPEFEALIQLREELTRHAAITLLKPGN